ncbi:hypothetical protein Ga0609869_003526 [Rhodovulum iodosum]|uniref:Uncharacterized protein n=1 Tax=Rhodovulum iodosum TaxID=68291 RepID=A0ABV3XXT1_9RHOB|nr:hypothetical protein [Rhodovulum robiginosum]RSK38151.1 hypothetical protein EJA01_02355 [Rhodovulum robiginosum]
MASLISFVAGFVIYARYQVTIFDLPAPVAAGLLYAVVVGAAALLTAIFLPRLRFMVEAMAFGRLIYAGLSHEFPEFGTLMASSPFYSATAVVAGGILCGRVLYGTNEKHALRSHASMAWAETFTRWIDDTQGRARDALYPVAPMPLSIPAAIRPGRAIRD